MVPVSFLKVSIHSSDADFSGTDGFGVPVGKTDDQRAFFIDGECSAVTDHLAGDHGNLLADGDAIPAVLFHDLCFLAQKNIRHGFQADQHRSDDFDTVNGILRTKLQRCGDRTDIFREI